MARPAPAADLDAYQPALKKWMPKAEIRRPAKPLARFDGIVTWRTAGGTIRYLVEEKRHLRHQDVAVIVDQLNRRRADLPAEHAEDRLLLLAPHVRAQQAAALERGKIDYLDLAGNVHLNAPYRILAEEADVALGTIAKCMNDLALRGLLLDRKDGRTVPDRQALVALWVQAYVEGLRPKLKERRFQVRAEDKPQIWARLRAALAERGQPWALTGADAAELRTHFFRADETEIYAPIRAIEERDVQRALVAQPAVRGGNLLIIEPPGPLAVPATVDEAIPVAPDLLAYAELRYRGTGQALEAAELLLPKVLGDVTH